jgi:predicted AAA+ superfamily ATPase
LFSVSWKGKRPLAFHHSRDKDGYEVDVVVQRGSRYVGIEVKAANSVHEGDFRGIKRSRELLGSQFHAGIVLYDGEHVLPFGDQLLAVPLSALWARKSKSAGKREPVTHQRASVRRVESNASATGG